VEINVPFTFVAEEVLPIFTGCEPVKPVPILIVDVPVTITGPILIAPDALVPPPIEIAPLVNPPPIVIGGSCLTCTNCHGGCNSICYSFRYTSYRHCLIHIYYYYIFALESKLK
jgi:hypothetical protein